jgi:hypothetical protein
VDRIQYRVHLGERIGGADRGTRELPRCPIGAQLDEVGDGVTGAVHCYRAVQMMAIDLHADQPRRAVADESRAMQDSSRGNHASNSTLDIRKRQSAECVSL